MNRIVKKDHNYVRFVALFALLAVIIFVRYGLQINIPRVVALIPIIAIALLGSQTEIIAVCMCLIPMHESLDFYYALVSVVIIYVIKFYRRMKINGSLILLCIVVIWELLHCFTTDFSPVTFVTTLAPIIALTVFLCSDFSDVDYAFVIRSVAVSAVVICVTMLVQVAWISQFNFTVLLMNLRRLGALSEAAAGKLNISGGLVQTNSLGVICVLITTGLLQLRMFSENKRRDIFFILALLIFGTFTASRTFLVCLVLMILLVIVGQKGFGKKLRYFGLIILAIGFVVLVFSVFFPEQLKYFVGRFNVEDITTGRDDLMIAYHEFITENPKVMFFGIGLQNYGDKLVTFYRVANNVPHNSIQEIIIAWGIIGLLLFVALIAMTIHASRKHVHKQSVLNYIPLIIILFKSVAGQFLTSGYSMLALSYAYLSLCQNFVSEKDTIRLFLQSSELSEI